MILLASGVIIAGAILLHYRLSIPLPYLTDDPNSIADLPLFTSLFTYISIMLWAGCAAMALLAAVLHHYVSPGTILPRFFGLIAGFLLFLAADDAFMLHERILPKVTGMSEKAVLLGYVFLSLMFLFVYFRQILRTDWPLFAIAGFFGSVFVDSIPASLMQEISYINIIEDGFKVAGILALMAYLLQTSVHTITPLLRDNPVTASSDGQITRTVRKLGVGDAGNTPHQQPEKTLV